MAKRLSKKQKNKERKSFGFNHPLVLLVFSSFCILSVFSLRKSSQKAVVSKRNIEGLEETVNDLELEVELGKIELEASAAEIYKEKIIRNELLQKKEGETILQIPEVKEEEMEKNNEDWKQLEAWKEIIF